jgi:CRP-like cAMP-binding protein
MALLDHQGRSASVTAQTDLVLAAVPEWGFKPFLRDHPEVTYRLRVSISRRLREAEAAKGKPA